MEAQASPAALVLKAGAGEAANTSFTIKATRRVVGESYELSGAVKLSNPTSSSWLIRDVRVEAVRPGEVRSVLIESAR